MRSSASCLATLDPGDEVVTGWPSFPSYVLTRSSSAPSPCASRCGRALRPRRDPRRRDATHEARLHRRSEQSDRHHEQSLRARCVLRTGPGGCPHGARPGVLRVHRRPRVPGRRRGVREGLEVLVLRTFSKIFDSPVSGSATASAVGRDHGDREGTPSLRRDVSRPGGSPGQPGRRRRARAPADGQPRGDDPARIGRSRPRARAAGPAVANFEFVRGDAVAVSDALLRQGVIVRPMGSFGAPDALRITAGTPEEIAFLERALDVFCRARSRWPGLGRGRVEGELYTVELSSAGGRPWRRSLAVLCERP